MNQWSRTRKRIILGILVVFLMLLVGVPFFFLIYQEPTCTDGKQNGDETGLDCGGSCQRLCSAESLPILIKGDPRVILVAPGVYEVVALFNNPNISAEIYRAQYSLKLYDASSTIPVKTIEGSTFVPAGEDFAIFEGPFTLEAGVVPTRAIFEWQKTALTWRKTATSKPNLEVREALVSKEDTTPRLDAVVHNLSLEEVSNIDLIALISDESGNIFASSKTFVDTLPSGGEAPIVFSWPRPFTSKATGVEIMIRVFPDSTFIR